MPRGDQRYPQHHRQGRDGYDEDWDDDVYYAAASGPGMVMHYVGLRFRAQLAQLWYL